MERNEIQATKEGLRITELLSIQHLAYSFPGPVRTPVFSNLSMKVRRGEFISVVGASGCGKSTLFRMIAGLLEPGSGEIRLALDGGTPGPQRLGKVAYMPQQDLLLPWRTALDNCLLPLTLSRRNNKQEDAARVSEMLRQFGLAGYEAAYPRELSGGMRQRVAFIRTLVTGSELMLLDEPFGALDALTKRELHRWLLDLWGSLNKTVLFITHDLEEALLLSDRIYLMAAGPEKDLEELTVELPRPRTHTMNYEPRFIELRAQLERRLYESKII
ncbi:ABC transporter ATP-binding protein [Paenibacillus donghaensis]|uniref:ABC transporter ATP-binding protein n=1 Tax=Paenibacillus donghaensis TaxID=414771 RepID=A0A2Z2KBR4_9BACL|nr:ABC transporter ATP-binding protein [Paenibacillus donghaensis]ASA21135.1 ABC transporter ATP-binding protein [Paenibacillus donghaensis]